MSFTNTMTKQIYVLTDDFYTPDSIVRQAVLEMVQSGVKWVQYRSKKPNLDERVLTDLIQICELAGAKFILNDNARLAAKLGAHGVHIGRDDGEICEALDLMRGKIVGVSCYDDENLALKAQNLGVSYVAFGAVFQSKTKTNSKICDLSRINFNKFSIPVALIGGIDRSNLAQILNSGASLFAVVSAAYHPDTISKNLANLMKILDEKG